MKARRRLIDAQSSIWVDAEVVPRVSAGTVSFDDAADGIGARRAGAADVGTVGGVVDPDSVQPIADAKRTRRAEADQIASNRIFAGAWAPT